MPVVQLDSSVQLDSAKPGVVELPKETKLDPQPGSDTSTLGRVAHGFQAPWVGLNVLASQAERFVPGISKETAAQDLAAAERMRREFHRQDSPGFSGWEVVGNLLNPLNYGGLGLGRAATVSGALGRAATTGATSALVQPEHGPLDVAKGALGGAVMGTAAEPVSRAIASVTPTGLDNFIRQQFNRAIKPSVAGKQTASRASAYDEQVKTAIKAIASNKANLSMIDPAGRIETGRLPQSLDEFQQAIDQTKRDIFHRYDALNKLAGQRMGMGLKPVSQGGNITYQTVPQEVTLAPIVSELRKFSSSKVIRDFSPSAGNYADQVADRLEQRRGYSTEEAQSAIQHLNASLRGYYQKDPTHEVLGAAGVDAMVANGLREALDNTIKDAVGPGYQELKNTYGALRKLEKDVVHRTIVTGRQELGGGLLGRISDVVSADEVIRGLIHLDPSMLATGGVLRAWRGVMRQLRSPDRGVRRIFESAEKLGQPQPSETAQGVSEAISKGAAVEGVASMRDQAPRRSPYSDTIHRAAQPVPQQTQP